MTVPVFIDLSTGEEIDGTPEAAERRRTAEREKQGLQQRVSAAEQRASVADERARALEERLRALTAHASRWNVTLRVEAPSRKLCFYRDDKGRCLNMPRLVPLTFHPDPQSTSLGIMAVMIDVGFRAFHPLLV